MAIRDAKMADFMVIVVGFVEQFVWDKIKIVGVTGTKKDNRQQNVFPSPKNDGAFL